MTIRIDEIIVSDLGPLKGERSFALNTFNLIYGKNERGKTFLVEFILRSLFRSSKGFRLRDFNAEGKVVLSGINGGRGEFTPGSKDKLEDYLLETQPGLPMDLAKLLVVRGAELSLAKDALVDRAILKEYLSSEATLDEIQEDISKTIRKASLDNGVISGSSAGEIKEHRNTREQLAIIDSLFDEINNLYSGGERAGLENRLAEIRAGVNTQRLAKRFSAHQLSVEKTALEDLRLKLPDEVIKQAGIDLSAYRTKEGGIQGREKRIAELETPAAQYFWVKNAISEYAKREARVDVPRDGRFQIVGWVALGVTALLLLLTIFNVLPSPLGPALSLLGALASGLFFGLDRRERGKARVHGTDIEEMEGIRRDFKERFGVSMASLVTLEAKREELEGAYHEKETLEKMFVDDRRAMNKIGVQVEQALSKLGVDNLDPEKWEAAIAAAEGEARALDQKIAQADRNLSGLDVDPSDYVQEDPGMPYQKATLDDLIAQGDEVDERLRKATDELESLKQRICQETKDDISTLWDVLIENLRQHRESVASEYRTVTAMILGKILVYRELEILRKQEDQKIQRSLESPAIVEPLHDITQRYERVSLEGDRLIVADKMRDLPLNDLSTGTQEQVLLALRVGCAAHVLGRQSLFLVLDDAFQHADWERRERLLDEVIRLGVAGWQILYLTMDDHIRDLFQERGERAFKGEFKFHNLDG